MHIIVLQLSPFCKLSFNFIIIFFNILVSAEQQQCFYICTHEVQRLEPSAPPPPAPIPDPRAAVSYWWGWLGVVKVSCILRHWGAQLILAYSLARPAILVAGKGRDACFYFFCFFTFIPVPLSSLSLSFISLTISSIPFLPFSGR